MNLNSVKSWFHRNRLGSLVVSVATLLVVVVVGRYLYQRFSNVDDINRITSADALFYSSLYPTRKSSTVEALKAWVSNVESTKLGAQLSTRFLGGVPLSSFVGETGLNMMIQTIPEGPLRSTITGALSQITQVSFAVTPAGKSDAQASALEFVMSLVVTTKREEEGRSLEQLLSAALVPFSIGSKRESFQSLDKNVFNYSELTLIVDREENVTMKLFIAAVKNVLMLTTDLSELSAMADGVYLGDRSNGLANSASYQRVVDRQFAPREGSAELYFNGEPLKSYLEGMGNEPYAFIKSLGLTPTEEYEKMKEFKQTIDEQLQAFSGGSISGIRMAEGPIRWKRCVDLEKHPELLKAYEISLSSATKVVPLVAHPTTVLLFTTQAGELLRNVMAVSSPQQLFDLGWFPANVWGKDITPILTEAVNLRNYLFENMEGDIGFYVAFPQYAFLGNVPMAGVLNVKSKDAAISALHRLEDLLIQWGAYKNTQDSGGIGQEYQVQKRHDGSPLVQFTISGGTPITIGVVGDKTIIIGLSERILDEAELRIKEGDAPFYREQHISREEVERAMSFFYLRSDAVVRNGFAAGRPFLAGLQLDSAEVEEFLKSLEFTFRAATYGTVREDKVFCSEGSVKVQ